jgi:hypothetical protein
MVEASNNDFRNVTNMDIDMKQSTVIDAGNTFIIEKPREGYQNSYPGQYFPGVINPLNKRTLLQNLSVDTRFRENYYGSSASDFQFDLPVRFTRIVSMELTAFEFQRVFYTISRQLGNNFFSVIFNINTDEQELFVITVPDGNYTPNALVEYLNNYATQKSIPLGFFLNLDITNTSGSGQLVIGIPSTQQAKYTTFTLDFQADIYGNPDLTNPLPLKMGWMLGYRLGIYANNANYVGEGQIDLTGFKYLYLVVDDYNNNVNNNFYAAFNTSILNQNILARISVTSSLTTSNVVTSPRQYFGPVDISKMHISLLDEYGRIVEVNNMDYSFCLTMSMIYDV